MKKKNKIILDVNHPGDVHFIRNLYKLLIENNFEVLIVASKKPLTYQLLEEYNLPHKKIGSYGTTNFSKAINLVWLNLIMLFIVLKFKPNAMLGTVAFRIAHIGWLLNIKNFCFDDTQHATEQIKLIKPFAYKMLTAPNYVHNFGKKHIRYQGYHELAYLHPNYFTADKSILKYLAVKENEIYTIIRFVAWNATHDKGMEKGFSDENKIEVVKQLEKFGKVFITSESGLPNQIKNRAIKIPVSKIHDAIAFSSLVFGESSTMSSEAACLGIPAIFIDDEGRCYTDEQESKFNLVYNYKIKEQQNAIEKGVEILKSCKQNKKYYQQNRQELLNAKIDVTAFQYKLITNEI